MMRFVVLTLISSYLHIFASRKDRDLERLPNERSRRDLSLSGLHDVLAFHRNELCMDEYLLTWIWPWLHLYSSLQDRSFAQMLTRRFLGISVILSSLLKVLEGLSSPSMSRDCASHPHMTLLNRFNALERRYVVRHDHCCRDSCSRQ